ncbi:hypothetical protein ANCDUO_01045 [Ancylostoma duodenale]|uniref:Uncharacterized protein n=1 Tax=Ancylostoma duodenale TaxID=51022 RepID=A0A0C2HAE7_9BILA|nr:hypothetical protein ANCDUO_01045 [Ancylostoma duodenale]
MSFSDFLLMRFSKSSIGFIASEHLFFPINRNLESNKLVNWTEYFHLISPPDVIPYIQPDLETITRSRQILKRIDLLLRNTSGRVITNYVMLMYALKWAELLDKNYREIIYNFKSEIDPNQGLYNREILCSSITWENYNHVMMAMHARLSNGRVGKDNFPIYLHWMGQELVFDKLQLDKG